MAEWLKAHDWKSCGQCPRGFESHPVRSVMSLSYFATSTYKKISESRLNPTPTHLQTEREWDPSYQLASCRERGLQCIHHLHRETAGVRGPVFGQSLKRSRVGRGSDGRSHGVEDVVVG